MKNQYAALPFYNEACELYAKGQIEKAKLSLYEAINTSFALTEAQLFLGKIFLDERQYDSAFLYLNSGIDFAVEQKPHHYFYMLEAGMKVGQYDKMKHNLKHFKKLYGSVDAGKYEEKFPYTVDDYEFYKDALEIVYDINYWKPSAVFQDSLFAEIPMSVEVVGNSGDDILFLDGGKLRIARKENCYVKSEEVKGVEEETFEYAVLSSEENFIFYFSGDNVGVARINSGRWISLADLPKFEIGVLPEYMYYHEEQGLLYVSMRVNDNLDLFVVKYNVEKNQFESKMIALDRINTEGDETGLVFKNGKFYFSSNGLPGFGGFDIYTTPHYNTINGIITPSDWRNAGKPYNSNADENQLLIADEYIFLSRDVSWSPENPELVNLIFEEPKMEEPFDYNIKIVDLPKDND